MKSVIGVQILSEAVYGLLYAVVQRKGMYLSLLVALSYV